MIKLGGLIDLKPLQEEKAFTATSKETGNVSVFKTKAARDAAVKAGTHEKRKSDKDTAVDVPGGEDKPKVNIFKRDSDRDSKERLKKMKKDREEKEFNSLYAADDFQDTVDDLEGKISDEDYQEIKDNLEGLANLQIDLEDIDRDEDNEEWGMQQDIIDAEVDDLKGLIKQAISKSSDSKDEPKSEPSKPKLESDPQAEKVAAEISKKYGITPEKMGEEDFKVAMGRAVYSALQNSNFHSEARELIAVLEDKPELSKRPDYPSIDDDDYQEKMDVIRQKYASTYTERDDYSSALGRETSDAAEWDGIKSVGTLTKQLRANGMSEFADKIESIFDKKEYMKKEGRISISNLVKENIINEGTRSQVGIIDRSGKIASAYVHYDGYPSNMKPGLKKHMKNEKDVLQLIKKGGARGIYNDKDIEYYKSGKPTKGNLKDFGGYVDTADRSGGAEYVYLYNMKDKKWYFADVYGDKKLKKLF